MKLNLSLLVVMSSLVGYIMIPDIEVDVLHVFVLFLGGLLVTASANACNEVIEVQSDQVMKRTSGRPLPDKRMTIIEAIIFVVASLAGGLFLLFYFFNGLAAIIAFISFLLYAFLYTPLKKISPIAVLVGAIPGSLPCLIGWAAGTNHIGSMAAWTLFLLQFFWQFPHFWSIAWIAHEDYEKAGMKMLPNIEKAGQYTAFQTVLYSAMLIPLGALPMVTMPETYGWISLIACVLAACWMLYHAIRFYNDVSDAKARSVMFSSFVYLPVVLLALVADKFL